MAKGKGFPGMGMGGGANMQQLMRQAQKMQEDMLKKQEELQNTDFTGTSGGGMVAAVVSGSKELKSVTINPECVDPDDVETLQDLIVAAINEAMSQASAASEREMGALSGGLNLGF